MKRFHKFVIAVATANLIVLCLAGTRAYASNFSTVSPRSNVARSAFRANSLATIRAKVAHRNQAEGGCGG